MRLSESTNCPSLPAGKATVPTPTTVIHSPDNDSVRPRDNTLRESGGSGGSGGDSGEGGGDNGSSEGSGGQQGQRC